MNQKKKTLYVTTATLIIVACATMTGQFVTSTSKTMIAPIMQEMVAFFSVDIGWTSLISTVPSLFMVLGALVSGALGNKFGNKPIALAGCVLFGVFGVLPALTDNFMVVLACRAIHGFGAGMTRVFLMAWVPLFFSGRQRDMLIGLLTTAGGIISSLTSVLGAYLASISWQAAFWGFSGVIIPIIFILLVPEPTKHNIIKKGESAPEAAAEGESAAPAAEVEKKSGFKGVPSVAYMYAILLFLEYAVITIIYSLLSVRMVSAGMSVMDAGVSISMIGYSMAVVAFLFGFVAKYLKRWGYPLAMFFAVLCFFLIAMADSIALINVGCICIGVTMGFGNSVLYNYVNIDCKENIPMSNAILTAGTTLGGFVSSFVLQGISSIMGTDYSSMFSLLGWLCVVVFVLSILVVVYANRRSRKLGMADYTE